jgi:phospholipase C
MNPNNPIEHVVIIVKENHTFDNYFGTFPGANGKKLPHAPDPVNDKLRHDHAAWLTGSDQAGKTQYDKSDIPAYWAYAQQYTLCDNYFSDVATESEPNHLFLIAADSPIIDNASTKRHYQQQAPYNLPSLPAALAGAGLEWRNYGDPLESYFRHITALAGQPWNIPGDGTQFDQDVQNVTKPHLPAVSWVYAPFAKSEHPTGSWKQGTPPPAPVVGPGMAWTVDRVNAVANSPLWATTAIFITWDDYGGWYDHVMPPNHSVWSGGGPRGTNYTDTQLRYGPRVPCLVISPYAKQGIINSTFCSHVSLVKFCLHTFGLAAFGAPPAALQAGDPSGDMRDCFDFTAAPRLGVPSIVPH